MHNPNNQSPQQDPHSTSPGRSHRLQTGITLIRKHGITLILLTAILYLWFRPPATVTTVDRPAADWAVQLVDGRVVTSEQLKGKVVLVNFWATWCPYCLKEMPVIEAFQNDHRHQGFEVLAISVDDTPVAVAQYMKKHEYGFAAGTTNARVAAAFGQTPSIPTSFVLDINGTIKYKIVGQVHYKRLSELTELSLTN